MFENDIRLKMAINVFILESQTTIEQFQSKMIAVFNMIQVKKLNPSLINPKMLKLILSEISTKRDLAPFDINQMEKYYSNLEVEVQVFEDYIVFKLNIPLQNLVEFEIWRMKNNPWVSKGINS